MHVAPVGNRLPLFSDFRCPYQVIDSLPGTWPLQDFRSLQRFCEQANHHVIAPPPHLQCPQSCNRIARLLPEVRPSPDPRLYDIHHTILVMAILCKCQPDTECYSFFFLQVAPVGNRLTLFYPDFRCPHRVLNYSPDSSCLLLAGSPSRKPFAAFLLVRPMPEESSIIRLIIHCFYLQVAPVGNRVLLFYSDFRCLHQVFDSLPDNQLFSSCRLRQ